MDRRKVTYNAVAGSGKTQYIIDNLNEIDRTLVITFTNNNLESIKQRVIDKFGSIPSNILVMTTYRFLYNVCLLPFSLHTARPKGIIFDESLFKHAKFAKRKTNKFYRYKGYVYSNKLSRLILDANLDFISRLNRYVDKIYIDEFQDIASDELDLFFELAKFSGEVVMLGDYNQITYPTSRRGRTNSSVRENIVNFEKAYIKAGFEFNKDSFSTSKRCSNTVCNFISEKLKIEMSAEDNDRESTIKFIDNSEILNELLGDKDVPKLFYKNSTKYDCFSMNWGNSKGLTFKDVCVVLNKKTYDTFKSGQLSTLAESTKRKFYVACTRSYRDLYFISEKSIPDSYRKEKGT